MGHECLFMSFPDVSSISSILLLRNTFLYHVDCLFSQEDMDSPSPLISNPIKPKKITSLGANPNNGKEEIFYKFYNTLFKK